MLLRPVRPRLAVLCVLLAAPAIQGATEDASPRTAICLNGMWEVLLEPKDQPHQSFADLPAGGWESQHVPGWINPRQDHDRLWARTTFLLRDEWRGLRVVLRLDSVRYVAQVYVNGVEAVRRREGDGIPIEVDLSQLGRFGEANTLVVHAEPNPYIKEPRKLGIEGDTWLVITDPVFVEGVTIRTPLRGGKRLEVLARVRNAGEHAVNVRVGTEVFHGGQSAFVPGEWRGRLAAGATRQVRLIKPWSGAVLWGFGKWGKPHLYHLHTTVESGGALHDRHVERFGFREFRAEGTQFLFNGKPYFLCGDLTAFPTDWSQHRSYFERALQARRAAGVSFLRIHSRYGFPHPTLFDVADELGFLLEPQHYLFPEAEWNAGVGHRQWEAQIRQFANHPSIVMWCADNEACSHGEDLTPELWERQNEIANLIRKLDPTRMVEEQGDVRLGVAEALGFYEKLDVWNVHPYGTPLGIEMKKQAKQNCYNGNIPIHVGELFFSFAADPYNWWTRPAEYVRRSRELYRSMMGQAKANADAIRSVAEAGAAGASLCALRNHDWHGYTPEGKPLLGPWHDTVAQCDEYFDPNHWRDKKYGRNVNTPYIQMNWPALSGRGMRAKEGTATCGNDGMLWINWFDPNTFSFFTTGAALEIRKAFEEVGGPVPPLAQEWAAEVVVKVGTHAHGRNERPDRSDGSDRYVLLDPIGQHGRGRQAARTDTEDRAWFSVSEPGRYAITALCANETLRTEIEVERRPAPTPKQAGYAHVQWVPLGGANVSDDIARLKQPARIEVRDRMPREQIEASWSKSETKEVEYQAGPFTPTQDGFLTDWLVIGPFPNPGDREKGYKGMATDYLAEIGGESGVRPEVGDSVAVRFPKSANWDEKEVTLAWRPWEGTKACDLAELILPEVGLKSARPPDVVAYAACYAFSPKAQPARLSVGSDDGIKVWLNDAKVAEDLQHGGAQPDEHIFEVELREGANLLLVKCDQSFGEWKFFLRFFGLDGEPMTDLRVARSPDVDPGFDATARLGEARLAALPFEDDFDGALDTTRWIEVGYDGNGTATCAKGDLIVTVTAETKRQPWHVHGVASAVTFDFMHGAGIAVEWETSSSRSWYTRPYLMLTTAPTGAQVHVDRNETWGKQPRFVVALPAITGNGQNSGIEIVAQNPGDLSHLKETVPGEQVAKALGSTHRLELTDTTYALFVDGKEMLRGSHGLRPKDWPQAHLQYVTMYNSGNLGGKYVSGLKYVKVSALKQGEGQ